ncbi:hypothetical protein ABHI18_008909 [Aspergillus niger]
MALDQRLWEPSTRCQLAWKRLPSSYPFKSSEEELKRHDEQVQLKDSVYLWDLVKGQFGTDNSGWVPLERWKQTNKLNRYLFDMYIDNNERSAAGRRSREMVALSAEYVRKDA